MILQALNDYYARKSADPSSGMPPPGYEWRAVPFVLEIDETGGLIGISDVREGAGSKKQGRRILLPQGPVGRTSGDKPYLLADNPEYLLLDSKKQQKFVDLIRSIPGYENQTDLCAVIAFVEAADIDACRKQPLWEEIEAGKAMMAFRVRGELEVVGQSAAVQRFVAEHPNLDGEMIGTCSVTGGENKIARLHPLISGVRDAKTTGAALVSFQKDSGYDSYRKEQAENAPVGKRAAFAYTTALNHLLAKGSRQRVQVGDASTVFWAEKASGEPAEAAFLDFINPPKEDDPDVGTQAVASLYRSVKDGKPFTDDDGQRFHVLGLAPNAARIAVRFWQVATIAELGRAFSRYFKEVEIERPAYDADKPLTLFRLLASTALLGKAENIQPNLGGDVMRAILSGGRASDVQRLKTTDEKNEIKAIPYPDALMQGVMRRIRAERDVNWVRAAILKAYLIRNLNKEITVSLNEESTDPGYRLGRLFAVLERVQERAQGNLNATIRERYYGAFSATPLTVMPLLMKLKNHHLAKLPNRGEAVNLEKLLGQVIDGLGGVPPRLTLAEQAQFAIGYYHQRQAFFSKEHQSEED